MKTIGLIGGISWESTKEYYRIINQTMQKRLGGSHSAQIFMWSFDFDKIEKAQAAGDWDGLTKEMVHYANRLKVAGADFIVICANTMHKMASTIAQQTGLHVLHIADVTGQAIVKKGIKKIALLGTKYVMEGDFYADILKKKHGIEVLIPNKEQRDIIHNIIYDELIKGVISDKSRQKYIDIIDDLTSKGSQGVVLGCTEIPLLINQSHVSVPVFSTMDIHAIAAVDYALADKG